VRALRVAEYFAWGVGLLLIATYGAVRVHGAVLQRQDLQRFDQARHQAALAVASGATHDSEPSVTAEIDTRMWSEGRIQKYRSSLEHDAPLPLAVLRIPKISLEVPVLDGTDEFVLNRAVGRIATTARPGEPGNIGIAGHRDGFFRGLKDMVPGDVIELVTLQQTDRYTVQEILIVDPDVVEVLDPTEEPSLTLVTCYPFYFVGSAPQRYIVRAVRSAPAAGRAASNGS